MISRELTRVINEPQLNSEDHYKILGVLPNATSDQIKLAYRQLTLSYHPDRKEGNNKDLYIKIKNAYETLIDPDRRSVYDSERKNASLHRNSSATLQIEYDETYFWRLRLLALFPIMSLASYAISVPLINSRVNSRPFSSAFFNNASQSNSSRSPLNNYDSSPLDRNLITLMFLSLLLDDSITSLFNNMSNFHPGTMDEGQSNYYDLGINQPCPAAASSSPSPTFNNPTSLPNSSTSHSDNRYSSFSDIILQHVERARATSLSDLILRHVERAAADGRHDSFSPFSGAGRPPNPNSTYEDQIRDDSDDEFISLLDAQRSDDSDDESTPAAARVRVTIEGLSGVAGIASLATLSNLGILFHSGFRGNEESASSNSEIPSPKLSLNHQKLDDSKFDGKIPEEFICPLSSNVMSDPVFNKSKGLPNVERAWILVEIERTGKNPFNNALLKVSDLQSNTELKERIEKFVDVAISPHQTQPKM